MNLRILIQTPRFPIVPISILKFSIFWRHDIWHDETQHNNVSDTQHSGTHSQYLMAFTSSVSFFIIMLGVVMLNVVAPFSLRSSALKQSFNKLWSVFQMISEGSAIAIEMIAPSSQSYRLVCIGVAYTPCPCDGATTFSITTLSMTTLRITFKRRHSIEHNC
jgi:hypothetical protein